MTDTGTSIDSEILSSLFTKFATKSDIAGGTGLGLFVSKNIIEAHGGKMWAGNNNDNNNDNGENKGATFSFRLPLRQIKYCQITNKKEATKNNRLSVSLRLEKYG